MSEAIKPDGTGDFLRPYKLIFITDIHADGQKPLHPSFIAACKYIHETGADEIVLGGDVGDFRPVSHWLKSREKRLECEGLRLADDYRVLNGILSFCQKRRKKTPSKRKVIYQKGNHEEWIDQAVEKNPEFAGLIELEPNCNLDRRGIDLIEYGEVYEVGEAAFTHGWYCGIHHAKQHVQDYKGNIYYGHTHDVQEFTDKRKGSHIIEGMSVGCLTDIDPDYNRKRPHKKVNAFAVFYFNDDGSYSKYVPIIINGRFYFEGKYYKGW